MGNAIVGAIPAIVRNQDGLYGEGNLDHYYQGLVFNATSNPYHNPGHIMYVLKRVHEACEYDRGKVLTPRHVRDALVGAILHDYGHLGRAFDKAGNAIDDAVNIERAIAGLREHVAEEDRPRLAEIESVILATQFPHADLQLDLSNPCDLIRQVIREADLSQILDPGWFNQIIIGLAEELNMPRIKMLEKQPGWLKALGAKYFVTDWARETLVPLIGPRLTEVEKHLAILSDYRFDADQWAWPKAYRPNNGD